MATAVAAEALEGEEAGAAFEEDSETNASSKGVNVSKLKLIGEGIKIGLAIFDLVRKVLKASEEADDRRRKRYAAGVLYPGENRDKLIIDADVPAYYSTSNIKKLLRNNILPYGWSQATAVNQGFGDEISAGLFRKMNNERSQRLKEEEVRERTLRSQKAKDYLFNKSLRNRRMLEIIETKVK